jgi:putative ABC transport system permease protein
VISNGVGNNFGERPDADAVPAAFVTHWQWSFNGLGTILMRTSSDPMALADPLRKILNRTPQLRMSSVETVDAQLSAAMAPRRFQATLLVTFGALALLLAMVGAYGVLSYAVTERRQEIGVRMALGATDGDVLRMVLKRAARLVGAGVAVGWLASAGLTRLMTSMLYGLKPTDPWTYAAASVLLVAVAMFAAWLPARRATQVDPIAALRYE